MANLIKDARPAAKTEYLWGGAPTVKVPAFIRTLFGKIRTNRVFLVPPVPVLVIVYAFKEFLKSGNS